MFESAVCAGNVCKGICHFTPFRFLVYVRIHGQLFTREQPLVAPHYFSVVDYWGVLSSGFLADTNLTSESDKTHFNLVCSYNSGRAKGESSTVGIYRRRETGMTDNSVVFRKYCRVGWVGGACAHRASLPDDSHCLKQAHTWSTPCSWQVMLNFWWTLVRGAQCVQALIGEST